MPRCHARMSNAYHDGKKMTDPASDWPINAIIPPTILSLVSDQFLPTIDTHHLPPLLLSNLFPGFINRMAAVRGSPSSLPLIHLLCAGIIYSE